MYRYAVGVLFFGLVWLLLFCVLPRVRRAMVVSSLLFSIAGPVTEFFHVRDYWSPVFLIPITLGSWRFGVEDFAFAAFLAGIGTGLYEWAAGPGSAVPVRIEIRLLLVRFAKGVLLVVPALWFITHGLGWNSLTATLLVMSALVVSSSGWSPRPLIGALPAGFAGGILMWVFYWGFFLRLFPSIIGEWWRAEALSGIALAGVPVEEVFWAAAASFAVGPVYRYGLRGGSRDAGPVFWRTE